MAVFFMRSFFIFSFPEVSNDYATYYFFLMVSLLLGVLAGALIFSNKKIVVSNDIFFHDRRGELMVEFLSFLWLICFLIYFFQMGSLYLEKSVTLIRYEKMSHYSGPSFLGVFLDSLGFFCFINCALKLIQSTPVHKRLMSITIFIAYLIYNWSLGGRIGILMIFVYSVLLMISLGYWEKMTLKKKTIILVCFLLTLMYFIHIVIERELYRGRDAQQSIQNVITSYSLTSNISSEKYNEELFVLLSFWYYLTHSINEFYYLFISDLTPMHGLYSYYKISYLFSFLGFNDFNLSEFLSIDRKGVYLGLLGSAYLDFKNGSFLYLFFIGFISSFFHCSFIKTHDLRYLFVSITFITTLLFSPVFFVLNVANGLSMILCSLFYYLSSRRSIL